MEESTYIDWMLAKKKAAHHYHHHHEQEIISGDSWEEQAFAVDAAGGLGCVWPPRSYSCSFCRREFRSAQALGGHMNVHRRERARLKQSPHTNTTTAFFYNNYITSTTGLSDSVIRVSSPSPPAPPVIFKDHSWKRFAAAHEEIRDVAQLEAGSMKNDTEANKESLLMEQKSCVDDEIMTSCKRRRTSQDDDDDDEEEEEGNPSSFFSKLTATADHQSVVPVPVPVPVVFNLRSNPVEDLDLELRLGSDAPAVK